MCTFCVYKANENLYPKESEREAALSRTISQRLLVSTLRLNPSFHRRVLFSVNLIPPFSYINSIANTSFCVCAVLIRIKYLLLTRVVL